MIPLTLTLKNFLSYGDQLQTINFEPYALICLSGKNGNGKSAMLDAMTWALWGQARKISGTSKADDGLLRLGQTRMMVSFEFSCNGRQYRIRREFAKTHGKPYAALDFELHDEAGGRYVSLTDKTIRGTQEKIEQLIGLDFETFVNSSFLRQGQSNEFSKKSPKERKQILTTILGLSQYDQLQQLALEHARGLTDEKKILSTLHEEASKECATEPALKASYDQEKAVLRELESQAATLQSAMTLLEQQKNEQTKLMHQHQTVVQEQVSAGRNHEELIESFREQVEAWKQVHYHMLGLPDSAALERERIQLREQEQEWRNKQQVALALHEQLLAAKELYHKEVHTLKATYEQALYGTRLTVEKHRMAVTQTGKQIQEAEQLIKEREQKLHLLLNEQKKIELQLHDREAITTQATVVNQQFEKRRAFYQVMVQKGNWLKSELGEFAERKTVLAEQQDASCPLCDQVLTLKRKQFLAAKLAKQESFITHRLNRVATIIKNLKSLLLEQHGIVQENNRQLDQFSQAQVRADELKKQHELLLAELKQVHTHHSVLCTQEEGLKRSLDENEKLLKSQEKELMTLLDEHPTLKAHQEAMTRLDAERVALGYDQAAHQRLHEQIQHIEEKIRHAQTVMSQHAQQAVRKNQVRERAQMIKAIRAHQQELQQQQRRLEQQLTPFMTLEGQLAEHKQQAERMQQAKEQHGQALARTELSLQRIEKIKQEQEQRTIKGAVLDRQADEYQALAAAFGKNGIQALLIEEAIPEIEQEANNLLAKLTDNQAQIFIESLRDLKKGGMKETLDIQISDSAGIRPYEMFSGGEAFRIDFALRIAISKLLARRAGTALQTLIIDEGFGSQDDEGLNRLMDALYAIQQDFSKVIIVSHLSAMKDNFPVHFIVEKRPEGSTVRVEERG